MQSISDPGLFPSPVSKNQEKDQREYGCNDHELDDAQQMKIRLFFSF